MNCAEDSFARNKSLPTAGERKIQYHMEQEFEGCVIPFTGGSSLKTTAASAWVGRTQDGRPMSACMTWNTRGGQFRRTEIIQIGYQWMANLKYSALDKD